MCVGDGRIRRVCWTNSCTRHRDSKRLHMHTTLCWRVSSSCMWNEDPHRRKTQDDTPCHEEGACTHTKEVCTVSWLHRVLTSCGPMGRTTGNCDARKDNLRLELLKAVRRKLRPARRTKAPTQHKRIATRSYTPMTSTHRAHIIVHPLPSRKTSFLLIQSHALNLFHGMGYLFFVDVHCFASQRPLFVDLHGRHPRAAPRTKQA